MLRLLYLSFLYWRCGGIVWALVTGKEQKPGAPGGSTASGSIVEDGSGGIAPAARLPPSGSRSRGRGDEDDAQRDAALVNSLKRSIIREKITPLMMLTSVVADLDLFADWLFLTEARAGQSQLLSDFALAFTVVGTFIYLLVTLEFHPISALWTFLRGKNLSPSQHISLGQQLLLNVVVEDIPQLVITSIIDPTSVAGVLNITTAGFSLLAKAAEAVSTLRDPPMSAQARRIEEDPVFIQHAKTQKLKTERLIAAMAMLVGKYREEVIHGVDATRLVVIAFEIMQADGSFMDGALDYIRRRLDVYALSLPMRELKGSIPSEMGSLSCLTELNLSSNQLQGPVPTEFGNLSALTKLELSINKLVGTIPRQLGVLRELRFLRLGNNQLTGSIPIELGNLSKLEVLDLGGNMLAETIPPGLGRLTAMQALHLHHNQLSGTIPRELGGLTALQELYLFSNKLTGTIPPELGELTALQKLGLRDNQLIGSIPDALGQLKALNFAWLYGNELSVSFGHGRAIAQRWPPRSPRSRQPNGLNHAGDSTAVRGAAHGRKSLFPALSARNTVVEAPSSSRSNCDAGLVDASAAESTPPLRSSLATLPIIVADLGLRRLFHSRGRSFPSGVAGMMVLFAGLVGLDRVAPSYAERASRILEPGSRQFMAWLPVFFVPAVLSWLRLPIVKLLESTSSLADAVVEAAKLEGAFGNFSRLTSPAGCVTWAEGRREKLRVAVRATKLLLIVGGGWLANVGSAVAIFKALSPQSPSPTFSARLSGTTTAGATAAAVAAAPSSRLRHSAADTSTVGFFCPRLVRRLGIRTATLGGLIAVIVSVFRCQLSSPFACSAFEALAYPLVSLFDALNINRWWLVYLTFVGGGLVLGATIGLATLLGFAAGRLVVSPTGALARLHPPMAVLLPLAASVAAPVAGSCAICLVGGDVSSLHDIASEMMYSMSRRYLMFHLLGPAVLSFAAPLFRMRGLISSNARLVVGGSVACAATGLFGVALGSRLLGVPRAFKTALQAKVQAEANTSLAFKLGKALRFLSPWHSHKDQTPIPTVDAALGAYAFPAMGGVLVLTGILGATFGARVLDTLGIKDRVVRALVQGGPLHVLGMAAVSEKDTQHNEHVITSATEASVTRDLSTASMILTGVAGAVLVSIPPVRSALLSVALGRSTMGEAAL
eukprot:g12969.t1